MSSHEEGIAKVKAELTKREEFLRESWVRAMEARLVQEELGKCHQGEGVNHYENCKWLADKYLTMLRENRVKGYKHIDV
ncbi:NADH-ubiquinone oxidoreductase 12 kDa subunit [Coprinopsis cinerea okayama7|uniref:NADH-ubiquinone oxidoreductase 12 kDa subunit n=1 Tax=Coprinopsis cinerea (strain Okayama-7 / 130 / ATCC MYA-4618 / FGSC 9003) TaxID=240176 RepID=A8NTZ8_COPC7|nr:NADH-ubiquinone oxidoreductase 12 kDa subunit [Coprinopsis cinerea okayama7\|eukprot:XP_001836344.1 NADH-ubiquinone oxidoreductase 12 kDa subunit [Coprinopsis cinerea okayama7\